MSSGNVSRQYHPDKKHIDRGNILFDKGDFDGAIAEYDKAIAIDPNHPYHYFNRGNARKAKKKFDLAISDYNKALSIDANLVDVYNNRGSARRMKGDLKGAFEDVNRSLALDPNNAEAYCNLALINLSLQRTATARSNFDKCYAIDATLKTRLEALASKITHRSVGEVHVNH